MLCVGLIQSIHEDTWSDLPIYILYFMSRLHRLGRLINLKKKIIFLLGYFDLMAALRKRELTGDVLKIKTNLKT